MAKRRQSCGVGEALLPSAPRSAERGSLEDLVAGLVDLDVNGLRLQWRNHLGGAPPAHLPRWLLLRVLGYRIQAAALGGLDKETLRVIRQPKGQTFDSPVSRPFEARIPATREGATLRRVQGSAPMVETTYLPVMCNHCDDAPCIRYAGDADPQTGRWQHRRSIR